MSDAPARYSACAVFLSYAREDTVAVLRIAEALRASGVEVWFDQNELVGGDAWDAKIRGQIASCALFVPVISAKTQARREGYFRLEWRLAAQRTHMMSERTAFLLPVVIDATREADADVPVEFKAVQWTRLPGGEVTLPFAEQIKRLVAPNAGAVQPHVTASPRATAAEAARSDEPARRQKQKVGWVIAAGVVAAIAVGMLLALRRPAVTDRSIAVLPFANLGADKGDEYLGDGMTEELLNVFAKIPTLKVAARTSSFFFKGKNLPIAEVGKQLGVAFVLEGSVRKTGNKLRITTQLINAADGYHLWSETYDRDMADLLAIQAEVSQQVVKALRPTLGLDEVGAPAKRATENSEAHRLYLLGRHHFMKSDQAGWAKALEAFNEAIRLDPNYALAYCGIADTYAWMGTGSMGGRQAWAKEEEMARKALAIDPNLPEAHVSLGIALLNSFRWESGERELRRALELNPNLTLALDQLAWACAMLERSEEAIALGRKALELEPLSAFFHTDLSFWYYMARRFDEAVAQARKAVDLDPKFTFAYQVLGWGLRGKGEFAAAAVELKKAWTMDNIPWYAGQLGMTLALQGDRDGAQALRRDLEAARSQRFISPGAFIPIAIGLGEKDLALQLLAEAVEQEDGICWTMRVDPIWDPIRNEPQFKTLLAKVFSGN